MGNVSKAAAMFTASPTQRPFQRIVSATGREHRPFVSIENDLATATEKRARRAAKRGRRNETEKSR